MSQSRRLDIVSCGLELPNKDFDSVTLSKIPKDQREARNSQQMMGR